MTPSSSSVPAGPAPWGGHLCSEATMTTVGARERFVSLALFSEFCTQTQSGLMNAPISQTRETEHRDGTSSPGQGLSPVMKHDVPQKASPVGPGASFT